MNIIKRLFCKHDYLYKNSGIETFHEADFSGDGCYNTWTERYDVYICKKCGKTKKVWK